MQGVITEYPLPTTGASPRGIVAAGSRIWFTEYAANKIGYLETSNPAVITEVPSLVGPAGIGTAPDGSVWYTAVGANEVVKVDANGTAVGHWAMPSGVGGPMVPVVDGQFWLGTRNDGRIDSIEPTNLTLVPHGYVDDDAGTAIADIVGDANGDVWFTDGSILRTFDHSANALVYSAGVPLQGVVPGPLGEPTGLNRYVTAPAANAIYVWSGGSFVQIIPVPTANSMPRDLVNGADKSIWFTEQTGNKIGRLTP
jgi:virginiamycin B lyase